MTIEKIVKYFEENEELFNDCMDELDAYNGYLGDDRYYPMEYINEFYNGAEPLEILNRAFFGRDGDSSGPFNPNRDYFYFNGYGNFVSTDYIDYSDKLDEYAIKALNEARRYIYTIDDNIELSRLFDELEEA